MLPHRARPVRHRASANRKPRRAVCLWQTRTRTNLPIAPLRQSKAERSVGRALFAPIPAQLPCFSILHGESKKRRLVMSFAAALRRRPCVCCLPVWRACPVPPLADGQNFSSGCRFPDAFVLSSISSRRGCWKICRSSLFCFTFRTKTLSIGPMLRTHKGQTYRGATAPPGCAAGEN